MMIMMTAKRMKKMMMTTMDRVISPDTKMRMITTMMRMKVKMRTKEDTDSVADMAASNRAVREGDSDQ